MNLENIDQHIVESFINQNHRQWLYERELPAQDQEKIKPLSLPAAKFIYELEKNKIFAGMNFPEEKHRLTHLFERVSMLNIENLDALSIQTWLKNTKNSQSQEVILSLSVKEAYWLPWEVILQNVDQIFYGFDKSIFDKSLNWWLFYRSDEVLTLCEQKLF